MAIAYLEKKFQGIYFIKVYLIVLILAGIGLFFFPVVSVFLI